MTFLALSKNMQSFCLKTQDLPIKKSENQRDWVAAWSQVHWFGSKIQLSQH